MLLLPGVGILGRESRDGSLGTGVMGQKSWDRSLGWESLGRSPWAGVGVLGQGF